MARKRAIRLRRSSGICSVLRRIANGNYRAAGGNVIGHDFHRVLGVILLLWGWRR